MLPCEGRTCEGPARPFPELLSRNRRRQGSAQQPSRLSSNGTRWHSHSLGFFAAQGHGRPLSDSARTVWSGDRSVPGVASADVFTQTGIQLTPVTATPTDVFERPPSLQAPQLATRLPTFANDRTMKVNLHCSAIKAMHHPVPPAMYPNTAVGPSPLFHLLSVPWNGVEHKNSCLFPSFVGSLSLRYHGGFYL